MPTIPAPTGEQRTVYDLTENAGIQLPVKLDTLELQQRNHTPQPSILIARIFGFSEYASWSTISCGTLTDFSSTQNPGMKRRMRVPTSTLMAYFKLWNILGLQLHPGSTKKQANQGGYIECKALRRDPKLAPVTLQMDMLSLLYCRCSTARRPSNLKTGRGLTLDDIAAASMPLEYEETGNSVQEQLVHALYGLRFAFLY
jgi:hypothetical protein